MIEVLGLIIKLAGILLGILTVTFLISAIA